jgi:hypothetical protein
MALSSKTPGRKKAEAARFVLGQQRFAKISAVEGISLTPAMKKRIKAFDEAGLSASARRKAIINAYRSKA